MSASEKLKALGTPLPANFGEWGDEVRKRGAIFLDALPQIVAVVAWAEKFSDYNDYHGWTSKEHPRLEPELDTALAALNEALP